MAAAALAAPLVASPLADRAQPVIRERCVVCHGPELQSGGFRIDTLSSDIRGDRAAAERWRDVRNVLNRGEMPPRGVPPLTTAEHEAILVWLDSELRAVAEARRAASSGPALRRLNRSEYQNTMRDLLGLELDYAKNLPPDQTSPDGFQNNGAVLRMSALQLEYYLKAARHGFKYAIVEGPAPEVSRATATESAVDKLAKINWTTRLGRSGVFALRSLEYPDEGEFVIRVTTRAELPSEDAPYPRLEVKLGYRADTQTPSRVVGVVDVANEGSQTFEFRGRIEEYPRQSRTQSKYPGLLIWLRNVYTDGEPAPPPREIVEIIDGKRKKRYEFDEDPAFPKAIVESVEFEAPVFAAWPPAHHRRLIPLTPAKRADESAAAREAITAFVTRAFRRPASDDSVDALASYFAELRPTAATYGQAMRETLAAALVMPEFLYLVEDGGAADQHALASRLSYFLWSTMPDEHLRKLADAGKLSGQAVLTAEVERMLADPRSTRFIAQFADQWLDLGGVDRVAINPNYYPSFAPALKADMRRETQQFVAALIRENRSALEFLRADFAMLNQPLAQHYGVRGPRGGTFELVDLRGSGRLGGLPSQASILLANSTGEDSHPIERGVWLRSVLLDDPPAPPPPAVPNLADSGETALLPLREQMKLHLDNAACASCHRGIDPWGVAFEEYDAVGLPRDEILRRSGEHEKRYPVDAHTTLPDGTPIDGLAQLQAYLAEKRARDFARALTRKLMAYALGRSLHIGDDEEVESIVNRFADDDYRMKSLLTMVVTSEAFSGAR